MTLQITWELCVLCVHAHAIAIPWRKELVITLLRNVSSKYMCKPLFKDMQSDHFVRVSKFKTSQHQSENLKEKGKQQK